jgi:hypothetical protein
MHHLCATSALASAGTIRWHSTSARVTLADPVSEPGRGILFTRLGLHVTGPTPPGFLRNVAFSEAPPPSPARSSSPAASPAPSPAKARPGTSAAPSGTLGYTDIEGFWIDAGGPTGSAGSYTYPQVAAAITGAESSFQPGIIQPDQPYGTTGWGLWQITAGNSVPQYGTDFQILDPWNNAEEAVYKYDAAGGFTPWTTYVDGAYEAFLQTTSADMVLTDPGEYVQINPGPPGTPPSPAADPGSTYGPPIKLAWAGPGGSSGCSLYANAHGAHIQITCGTNVQVQYWSQVYQQRWTDLNGAIVTVGEEALGSTGECINLSPAHLSFYLDSCAKGDANELFYLDRYDPHGDYWFINVAESDSAHANYFMTASSFNNGAYVVASPAGAGSRAVWFIPAAVRP